MIQQGFCIFIYLKMIKMFKGASENRYSNGLSLLAKCDVLKNTKTASGWKYVV